MKIKVGDICKTNTETKYLTEKARLNKLKIGAEYLCWGIYEDIAYIMPVCDVSNKKAFHTVTVAGKEICISIKVLKKVPYKYLCSCGISVSREDMNAIRKKRNKWKENMAMKSNSIGNNKFSVSENKQYISFVSGGSFSHK